MTELTCAVRAAQADADRRFGDGPVPPWQPPPVLGESAARRMAGVAVGSLLATALLVAFAVSRIAPDAESDPVVPISPALATTADDARPAEDSLAPVPTQTVSPAAPVAGQRLSLERRGAEWHLWSQGAARKDVIQRLAEASGATLHGGPDAAAGARPVQLRWQGRSLAQLWPLVLGPELSFALQCRRERCAVWILAAARAGAATNTPHVPSPAFEPVVLPLPMPMPGADQDGGPIRD